MRVDAVALAQELIRFETVNPPGAEEACAEHLARVLEPHGFTLERHEHEPTRTNLVARRPGTEPSPAPLVFTGHLDTVPLGSSRGRFRPLPARSAVDGSSGAARPT